MYHTSILAWITHILSALALNSFPHLMAFGQANRSISQLKLDKNCSGALYSIMSLCQTTNSNWDQLIKCIWNHVLDIFRMPFFFCLVSRILQHLLCVFMIWSRIGKLALPIDFYSKITAFWFRLPCKHTKVRVASLGISAMSRVPKVINLLILNNYDLLDMLCKGGAEKWVCGADTL